MKRSIYQKLLLSLATVALFGTLASAQVLTRSQVDYEQIQTQKQMMSELKAKAKAQGLTATPEEWIQQATEKRTQRLAEARAERANANRVGEQEASKAIVKNRLTKEELAKIAERKVEKRAVSQREANEPDTQTGNTSYVLPVEPIVNTSLKKDVRIIPPRYIEQPTQDASEDNQSKEVSTYQLFPENKPKTKEERRQEILEILNTTTNEEEIKKCKAILKSLN